MINNFQYRQEFLNLIDCIREILGYALRKDEPDPGEEIAMEMMYGGFDFAVAHSLKNHPEKILIECKFGGFSDFKDNKILLNLLEMNFALSGVDGSVFCIDPQASDLLYTFALDLKKIDGLKLLEKMTEIVWHGRRWIETKFLQENPTDTFEALNPAFLA